MASEKFGKVCALIITGVSTLCMGLVTSFSVKEHIAWKEDRARRRGYNQRLNDERMEQLENEVKELRAENDRLFAEALDRTEGTA